MPGHLRRGFPTLGGLAHGRSRDPEDPLQRALIATRLGATVFVRGEAFPGWLSMPIAPSARPAGYRSASAIYMQPAVWWEHVEQPAV